MPIRPNLLLLILLGILLTCSSARAHESGSILGTVYDARAQLPLRGVAVRVLETGRTAVSNELGRYRFDHMAEGTYCLSQQGAQASQPVWRAGYQQNSDSGAHRPVVKKVAEDVCR
ncbi:peptidase associated/transthyretin-like domain-containing protein [Hymenobacter psychrotolerans]|uniref:Carboxypeptidase regulatory-like domain-containing protein n=1 Tax=Hymenobacter psychrotolerans DSM 18569 TaxID=1121959 RepID=A0A1M7F3H3_9BACT|nr:hypothetical protein [Hymenobacter psychrotolerans]SHL98601.1 Carboxypeptidase regulatory-like domain-containing protein [Hymenobacter psychrotolerans DSM 18569]